MSGRGWRGLPPLLFLLAGLSCFGSKPLVLGEPAADPDLTSIGAVLAEPARFADTVVTVEGEIGSVCQDMGCWFTLHSGGEQILVDLEHGRIFTIPLDSSGRYAVVTGRVVYENSDLKIIGTGAILKDAP